MLPCIVLAVKVNYNEERQNETPFGPTLQASTSYTPKKRPIRLEPLIEEIESSDNNTPSYEYKEVGAYYYLINT